MPFFRRKSRQQSDQPAIPPGPKVYPTAPKAVFPLRLTDDYSAAELAELHETAQHLATQAQYGWGHTIDFGPFRMEGILLDSYLQIAGLLDAWKWWPSSLAGLTVADVGCLTGGLSLLLAARGAEKVYAVDEIPQHVAQCAFVAETFQVRTVECLQTSLYHLPQQLAPESLDLIVFSGVLYHLSDMMVGLLALQTLLKPGGTLFIESNAIDCFTHSYANFGQFFGGMWWQPTGRCIQDMCEFTGYERPEVRFYNPQRCLARAVKKAEAQIPFKRGLNWPFMDLRDEQPRALYHEGMTAVPCEHK
jgi:tRNA (mo5U34)-methyltransferase